MRYLRLALPVLVGLASSARAADTGQLVLSDAQIRTGGIESSALRPVRRAATLTAFGQVLDPGVLATTSARLALARAGVAQAEAKIVLARAQEARAATLFRAQRNISRQQYQTAEAAAQVAEANLDAAKARLRSAQARLQADWGRALAPAIAADTSPVPDVINATSCLLEVTLPLGAALTSVPGQAEGKTPTGATVSLRLVGPSPRTPAGSGPSYFYLGSGGECPPTGMSVQTHLPDGPERAGVVVPASAVVWRGGEPLAFRDDGGNGFAPVSLAEANPVSGGYFLAAESNGLLRAGQKVVVKGAALLLSQAEMGSAPKPKGDDDD
jgi:multidrug efflux system membrane fusion protein